MARRVEELTRAEITKPSLPELANLPRFPAELFTPYRLVQEQMRRVVDKCPAFGQLLLLGNLYKDSGTGQYFILKNQLRLLVRSVHFNYKTQMERLDVAFNRWRQDPRISKDDNRWWDKRRADYREITVISVERCTRFLVSGNLKLITGLIPEEFLPQPQNEQPLPEQSKARIVFYNPEHVEKPQKPKPQRNGKSRTEGVSSRRENKSHNHKARAQKIDFSDLPSAEQKAIFALIESDDEVGIYIKEAGAAPLLTYEEEVELAKRIDIGDQEAKWQLARSNTRLVVSVAKRYIGRGVAFLDLIQEGNGGLMIAVKKYDWTKGYRFSTYATWWIKQKISRATVNQGRTIRIPVNMNDRMKRMFGVIEVLNQELGRKPTEKEIAEKMEEPVERVKFMLDKCRQPRSLQEPYGEEEDDEFGDFIEDTQSPSPQEIAAQHQLEEFVEEALSVLQPRQAEIIRLRFGMNEGYAHTLEEIAKKFGLSRERIRQLEKQALRILRSLLVSEKFSDFS